VGAVEHRGDRRVEGALQWVVAAYVEAGGVGLEPKRCFGSPVTRAHVDPADTGVFNTSPDELCGGLCEMGGVCGALNASAGWLFGCLVCWGWSLVLRVSTTIKRSKLTPTDCPFSIRTS